MIRTRDDIDLAGRRYVIERPVDSEALIDEATFARDEFLPYWAELWPSGIALATRVGTLELQGLAVLELGCGLGLPSLVAAARGATVLATDWASDALDLLTSNAAANRLAVQTRLIDWRDPDGIERSSIDVVLAADVLYEERNARPLLACLEHTLRPSGVCYLTDPGRRHAQVFFDTALAQGWEVAHTTTAPALPAGGLYTIRRAVATQS